jgi:hypothetical protein
VVEASESTIVKPGDVEATNILQRYQEHPRWNLLAFVLTGITLVAACTVPEILLGLGRPAGEVFGLSAGALGLLACAAIIAFAYPPRALAYERMIKQDRIVLLNPWLVRLWDQMRTEEDLALTSQQRTQHLTDLFQASIVLRPSLVEYEQVRGSRSRRADAELAEAKLRAALRPLIDRLKLIHPTQESVMPVELPVIVAEPGSSKVQAELETLRAHRQSQ